MDKIYVVEEYTGDWKNTIAVFSKRENAEKWCNEHYHPQGKDGWSKGGHEYDIEEYDLYD